MNLCANVSVTVERQKMPVINLPNRVGARKGGMKKIPAHPGKKMMAKKTTMKKMGGGAAMKKKKTMTARKGKMPKY